VFTRTHDVSHVKVEFVIASRDFSLGVPIQSFGFKEDDWVLISNGGEEEALSLDWVPRHNHLEPRSMCKVRLRGL
jgi:hypothetical protein